MAIFIAEEKIAEIKYAADIVDVISEAVILKPSGKNLLGLCPFHSEKTPSFTVNPEKQIFYCFGCGAGGNVFSFLMKQAGLSFPEAARQLAIRYGVAIPVRKMSAEEKQQQMEKEGLFEINHQAMAFFQYCLRREPMGDKARAYLKKRGMTDEIIDKFGLGYAPAGWDNLERFFAKKRISPKRVEKSGLIAPRTEKNGYYDRFRDRIIFPIFNPEQRVVGFGGRVMDDSLPKYLNSPETPLYNKRGSLYGWHAARNHCRKTGAVYIVEGYFDLLSLHRHGINNSVATLGTAITPEHIRILKGCTTEAILVFDSDDAGIRAASRSIDLFDKEGVEPRIMVLPAGCDPDSYLLQFGVESFLNAAENASGAMPFLIQLAENRHGLSIEGKVGIVSDLVKPLAAITDGVKRSLYIKSIVERLGVDEGAIREKIRHVASGKRTPVSESAKTGNKNRMERQIITMMLQYPGILPEIRDRGVMDLFEDETLKSIGHTILAFGGGAGGLVSEMMTSVDDENQRRLMAELAIGENLWEADGCRRLISQFEASRSREESALLRKIKAAEASNDHGLLLSLLREKQALARRKAERHIWLSGG